MGSKKRILCIQQEQLNLIRWAEDEIAKRKHQGTNTGAQQQWRRRGGVEIQPEHGVVGEICGRGF